MLSIQDVGTEIMRGTPSKFYIFLGKEYGIKEKYLEMLKDRYGGDYVEFSTVSGALSLMKKKHLIPLTPKLYIVRYDETFIQEVSPDTQKEIDSLNIKGTIVCIYEDDKHAKKLAKCLPDYSVSIDSVNATFVQKYLTNEFKDVPQNLIQLCVSSTSNYSQARNMCRCISYDIDGVASLDSKDVSFLFGTNEISSDTQLRYAVASRNSSAVMSVIDIYSDTWDNAMYTILSTMIEFEKLHVNKHAESDIRSYLVKWPLKDIYYYFNQVYDKLYMLRSNASVDGKLIIMYLASLLAFSEIPEGGCI